jgi:hypothetical protein
VAARLLYWLLLIFPTSGVEPEAHAWSALVEPLRCRSAVEGLFARWGVSGEILRAPGGLEGREVYRLATRELGVWVTLEKRSSPAEAVLFRTGPEGTSRVALDSRCRPSASDVAISSPGLSNGGFDDEDLRTALEETGQLVVFLWSPHMPLSVDAYPEIEGACRELRLPFRAVTDPSSDRSYVDRVAGARGIPPEARLPLASVELLFRDLAVHAPAVMVFTGGKVSAPLPGFRDRDDYTRFLEGEMERKRSTRPELSR